MTVINTNTASINAQFNLNKVNQEMEKAMEQLSSGKRINSAGDDAAGIAIASRMESQVRGLNQAMRNAADGQSLVDTAEGAMDEISNMLQRMRELALQSANDTNSDNDRANLNAEIEQLTAEIDRVVSTTKFNGQSVLDGSLQASLQIGSNNGETLGVTIASMGSESLGSITGAASSSAVLSSSMQGVQAEATIAKIAFNGNDTFGFTLTADTGNLDGDVADPVILSISAAVSNMSAAQIAAEINEKAEDAGADQYLFASSNGNVVTIENSYGGTMAVAGFTAETNSTATYSTVAGDVDTSDSVTVLGSTPNNVGNEFATSGAADPYLAATDATSGVKAQYTLDLTTAATAGDAGALTWPTADSIQVAFGEAYTIDVDPTDATTVGDFAAAINAKTSDWTFSVDITADENGDLQYTLIADAIAEGEFGAISFTAVDADGTGIAETFAALGDDMTAIVEGENPTDPVAASGGENLYLELLSADTYSMTINDVDLEFAYNGTSASRDAVATTIETALNASGAEWNVSNTDGRLHITNEGGNEITLAGFASNGSGRAVASTDAATAGDLGTSQLLDDTDFSTGATTVETNTGAATVVELSFSGDDTFAFKVSDGIRTAVVDPTAVTFDDTDTAGTDEFDYASMAAAIEYGLGRAGMENITVAIVEGDTDAETVITLTEATGKEISMSSFVSDASGSMLVGRGSDDTTGVTRYLDDGVGDSSTTVSNISVGTVTGAQAAISIIDRALEDVNTQRSELGAISNRLDHTISNLGNVVINTEASQSRIEDADFAKVTGDLTKAQITSQAATAMLAQANASKQGVLSLLQG